MKHIHLTTAEGSVSSAMVPLSYTMLTKALA